MEMELDNEMDIDFAQYISDDEDYDTVDLTSDLDEEEVDIFQGLPLVLIDGDEDFEELSDLSDLEEEQANPAGKEPVASPTPLAKKSYSFILRVRNMGRTIIGNIPINRIYTTNVLKNDL